jgi:hypothetical protein
MKERLNRAIVIAGIAIVALLASSAYAQTATHPHYIHARSDLAKARQLMQQPDEGNVMAQLRNAVNAVNSAIGEIDRAAVLDKKDMDDHPAVDTNLKCLGKFREIFRLLRAAQTDIDQEEDNPNARPWRGRANGQINEARQYVKRAILLDEFDDTKVSRK